MHWKTKAKIQNAISLLPSSLSYSVYYWIQRHFGRLKKLNPVSRLNAGVETWKQIQAIGYNPCGKVFLEIGTGRVPNVPLAYWLMGAKRIITIDTNPYVKEELIKESIEHISENKQEIHEVFGALLDNNRLEELINFGKSTSFSIRSFLELCQIDYIAPGDAEYTKLEDNSIDFHTSYTVFEHIPPNILYGIIKEGNRIIRNDGLFVHRIDYSDHFSHSDSSITSINFLQYTDSEWNNYAGNRYMYMNRLRHDDFLELFESLGHHILVNDPLIDPRALDLLKSGTFTLSKKFRAKSLETVATGASWLITKKND